MGNTDMTLWQRVAACSDQATARETAAFDCCLTAELSGAIVAQVESVLRLKTSRGLPVLGSSSPLMFDPL